LKVGKVQATSPDIHKIMAELIQAGSLRSTNLLIVWKKEELPEHWKASIVVRVFIRRVLKL
jgi:hypothetical protein